jgi:hypothetical protein
MSRRLAPETVAEILRLHREGLPGKWIAARVGVSPQTVSVYVRRTGEAPQRRLRKGEGRRVAPLEVPDRLDEESRRVLNYVNHEIQRWNAGERNEPLDLILEAAKDRIRRAGR